MKTIETLLEKYWALEKECKSYKSATKLVDEMVKKEISISDKTLNSQAKEIDRLNEIIWQCSILAKQKGQSKVRDKLKKILKENR